MARALATTAGKTEAQAVRWKSAGSTVVIFKLLSFTFHVVTAQVDVLTHVAGARSIKFC